MIGRSFGRYRIVESLGEGGMGTVWRAEDDLLGRSVALKLLSATIADSAGARARLLREARAAGALDHPGIGTVYDAGEQDGDIYIAMRLVDGGTVADRIRSQGALGLLDAVRIAAGVADALAHAHAHGILHRDVSARNLMLTKDGQVVVVDFGLALAEGASRLTQTGMAAGTAHYMAPEAIQGKAPDRRSDIYSLGAVLYEMVTGAPPFEGKHLQTVLYAAVNTPAAPPSAKRPGIPPELDRMVLKSLAKAPDERYATMEALRDDLESFAASGVLPEGNFPPVIRLRDRTLAPTTSLDPDSTDRSRLPARSRRRVMVAIGVVILVLAASGIAWRALRPVKVPLPLYSSLAVLPFSNESENPAETAYLAEGLSEALIIKLTQMTNLRVPPWMTVGRFRDSSVPVETLASKLKVDAVLIGTYQSDGKRIHGTVSIVDGRSGRKVWSDAFDEPLADLFGVQNRIAIHAATRVLGRLSGQQLETLTAPAGGNVEAYALYLKGSLALQTSTKQGAQEAAALFRQALELDPRLAQAWVGLGAAHTAHYYAGGDATDLADGEAACLKALELDPNSIAARRGLIRVFYRRGKSEACLKQGKLVAASGARGIEALLARAEAYLFGGLETRSLPLLRQVMEEDPANQAAPWLRLVAGCFSGSFQEAINAGERYLTEFGEDAEVHQWLAVAYHSVGRRKDAESHIQDDLGGGARFWLAAFYRQTGRPDDADRLMLQNIDEYDDKLARAPNDLGARFELGASYGMVGDLTRFRAEVASVRSGAGKLPNDFDAVLAGIVGDRDIFIELRRDGLRAGMYSHLAYNARTFYVDPNIEDYPGYKELAAEEAAEFKRLEALY